jgi:hypothetical protein
MGVEAGGDAERLLEEVVAGVVLELGQGVEEVGQVEGIEASQAPQRRRLQKARHEVGARRRRL